MLSTQNLKAQCDLYWKRSKQQRPMGGVSYRKGACFYSLSVIFIATPMLKEGGVDTTKRLRSDLLDSAVRISIETKSSLVAE